MVRLRKGGERGHAQHGWLDSWHTFSFSDYYDPSHMGFRDLRVINEDRVEAGEGFPSHGHRDMEILSYVLEGALEHKDSLGTGSVIRPGDVQRMSAGRGVKHSEKNASDTDGVHFLQIWILPEKSSAEPGYEQKHFTAEEKRNRLRLLASPDGADGSIRVHQDVKLLGTLLAPEKEVAYALGAGRHAWVHVARGDIKLNGQILQTGDAAAISDEKLLKLRAREDSEVLLFDLK